MSMDISHTLNRLQEERQNIQYTPPVGYPIVWHPSGEESVEYAARVTRIEAPGKLSLEVTRPNSPPEHKTGVQWHRSPTKSANPADANIKRNGTWDYNTYERRKPPKAHEELHVGQIETREAAAKKSKEEYDLAEKARLEREDAKKKQPAGAA